MVETDGKMTKSDWALLVSILGFVVAIGAYLNGTSQAKSARTIPFQSALYTARVNSMQGFARAQILYERQLSAARSDLPYDVFSSQTLAQIDDRGMQESAFVARPVLDALAQYNAEISWLR